MRKAFHEELLKIAQVDPRVFLLLGDLGYGEVEAFAKSCPDQFCNVGVAEQNMAGIACGLAMEGYIVVIYSIANFPILRCLEQIRNDICYHGANVKIVTTGSGLAYGPHGMSHHNTEDIAIMRALPEIVVLSPADCLEARGAVRAMMAHDGPIYYRCGYKNEPDLHGGQIDFQIGRAIPVRDGRHVTLIGAGPITYRALGAAELLARDGIEARVISMATIKPIDKSAIITAGRETGAIVTIEEHNVIGGLGGAVAEVLAETGTNVAFKAIGIPDTYVRVVGTHGWLLDRYGFSPQSIAEIAKGVIRRRQWPSHVPA